MTIVGRGNLDADARLPAQRGGAKAVLLSVLGEFVLPAGGAVWTSTLVAAADLLGIGEKNARQAIARIADQGLLTSERDGRRVRWTLTDPGRLLLESGAERIYSFGHTAREWDGTWLLAHCPVPESQRATRNRLRSQLGFLGFGELSASLLLSPHLDRERELRRALADLDLADDCTILRSTTAGAADDVDLARRAWDLDELAAAYRTFSDLHARPAGDTPIEAFRDTVELVHDWRRFPSLDPELPTHLLPSDWEGSHAAATFRGRRAALADGARRWFRDVERGAR